MTSTTIFIIFIPILAFLLLAINLILAPHNPYQEKDSTFECGFHSFLGQNRTQFNISFFMFGLLFLLFDLEILLIYPYSVSNYSNDIYGLVIMLIFFILLTLGFIYELGKNALTIESRQTSVKKEYFVLPDIYFSSTLFTVLSSGLEWALSNPPKPHAFTSLQLKSAVTSEDLESVVTKVESIRVPSTSKIESGKPAVEHQADKDKTEAQIDDTHRSVQDLIDQGRVEGNLSNNTLQSFQARADQATNKAKAHLNEAYEDILQGEYETEEFFAFLVIGDIPVLTIVFMILRLYSIKFFSLLKTLMLLYFNKYKSVIAYLVAGLCSLFILFFLFLF